jgi:hypothetical protein
MTNTKENGLILAGIINDAMAEKICLGHLDLDGKEGRL